MEAADTVPSRSVSDRRRVERKERGHPESESDRLFRDSTTPTVRQYSPRLPYAIESLKEMRRIWFISPRPTHRKLTHCLDRPTRMPDK